jgi:ferredoxin
MGMLLTGRRISAARRCASAWSTRSCRRPASTPRRPLGRRHPRLRAALGEGDQADGAQRRQLSPQEAQMLRLPPWSPRFSRRSGRRRASVRREARAVSGRALMTYVITSTCIDVKDGICQKVCPVECIYEGGRMMYIQPDECINCGYCLLSVLPGPGDLFEDLRPCRAEEGAVTSPANAQSSRARASPA